MGTTFKDRTAIAGIGWTEDSRASGKSTLHLADEACKKAIEDSGLRVRDIDGVVTFNVNDSVSPQWVAASLGLPELRYHLERWGGGTSAPAMVARNPAHARELIEIGFRFVTVGSDAGFVGGGARAALAAMRANEGASKSV